MATGNPGVSGGTASGKTTVCDMIIQQLHDHRVFLVNQDSFYRGLSAEESECVREYNFDHPDAFDTEQMLECIVKLKQGNSVQLPIYDFKNHRRCSESFRQQKIIIQNNHGEKLVGLLHETRSKEIVIACHGLQSTKEHDLILELCFAMEKQGISAFRFDFSGNGESEGLFQFGNYLKEVDDLHAVIQHFTAANRAVSSIIGHSKGGNIVVLYASLHHDIKKVINVSGRYKMDRGIEEHLGKNYLERSKKDGFIDFKSVTGELLLRANYESIMERLNTNMHKAGLNVDQDCRVLTIHGSVDEFIPVEDALEFAKIIPNHELKIVQGADHCYNKHRDELVSAVLAFIKDNIYA